jgi:ClpP class serine protease
MFEIWGCEENYLLRYLNTLLNPDVERLSDIESLSFCFGDESGKAKSILSINGSEAKITIKGILSQDGLPAIMRFFGFEGTAYTEIVSAVNEALANEDVKTIRLVMDTPGGEVKGVDSAWSAIHLAAAEKIVIAENHGLLASAGYWIASAAGKINALSPVAETGSIGVVATFIDNSKALEERGFKRIEVLSRNAPDKRPDATTKKGLLVIQERVNAIERVFISRIAKGRGLEEKFIEANFGRGTVLVAQDPEKKKPDALTAKMIDAVSNGIAEAGNEIDEDDLEMLAGATPPFKDFPIVDKTWDADAAIKRVKKKTGSKEKPSSAYKNAFFWYDNKKAELFGSYKLPFVDIENNRMVAVRKGVQSANGAMKGARGGVQIPAADRAKVQNHIDRYLKKIENQDKKRNNKASEGNQMDKTLQELIAEDPKLAAEVEKIKTEAKAKGEKEFTDRAKVALPILESDKYPKPFHALACQVLKGETPASALTGAVTVFDSMEAQKETDKAADDTKGTPATPAQPKNTKTRQDGSIESEEEYQATIAAERAAQDAVTGGK